MNKKEGLLSFFIFLSFIKNIVLKKGDVILEILGKKLNKPAKITFNSTEYHNGSNADKVDTLVDGSLKPHSLYGVLVTGNKKSHFEFTIYTPVNIYAYGTRYSDSGGSTPTELSLYKLNKKTQLFESYKQNIETKENIWYKLFDKLLPGTYKMIGYENKYNQFTEWYVESLSSYIIKRDNNYYSTTMSMYDDKNENRLIDITDNMNRLDDWIKDITSIHGFNLGTYSIIKTIGEVINNEN